MDKIIRGGNYYEKRMMAICLTLGMTASMLAGCGSSTGNDSSNTSSAAKEETSATESGNTASSASGKKYVIATDTVFAPLNLQMRAEHL